MGKLRFRPVVGREELENKISLSTARKPVKVKKDTHLVDAEIGKPKWSAQRLHCAKLSKMSGIMTCEGESTSIRKDPFPVVYAYRVCVDRPRHVITKVEEPKEGEQPQEEGPSPSR